MDQNMACLTDPEKKGLKHENFIHTLGRYKSKGEGACVANGGGKSSMPGKRVLRKWPSN